MSNYATLWGGSRILCKGGPEFCARALARTQNSDFSLIECTTAGSIRTDLYIAMKTEGGVHGPPRPPGPPGPPPESAPDTHVVHG